MPDNCVERKISQAEELRCEATTSDYVARNMSFMPPRNSGRLVKTPSQRRRTFIREWRKFRRLTQDQLAEPLGITGATVSRIENREIGYGQDLLEGIADQLGTHVSILLSRAPDDRDAPPPPEPIGAQASRRRRN